MEELLTQPDGEYLTDAMQNYARAIEQVLAEVPVVNGTVDLETIWMELALPRDLIIEVFQATEIRLPVHVERVLGPHGQMLSQQKPTGPKKNLLL
jgi:hypothetical protein